MPDPVFCDLSQKRTKTAQEYGKRQKSSQKQKQKPTDGNGTRSSDAGTDRLPEKPANDAVSLLITRLIRSDTASAGECLFCYCSPLPFSGLLILPDRNERSLRAAQSRAQTNAVFQKNKQKFF